MDELFWGAVDDGPDGSDEGGPRLVGEDDDDRGGGEGLVVVHCLAAGVPGGVGYTRGSLNSILMDTRRYGPTSSSCGGLQQRAFFGPLGKKTTLLCCLGQF